MTVLDEALETRIAGYLSERLEAPVELRDVQRIAVGWSHETWLFDAAWSAGGAPHRQGFCVRRDPGNALLREMSDLGTQYAVLRALESTAVPAPKAFFYEEDPAVLGAPFLVMERVDGVCPSPWGRDGQAFYRAAAARGVLPLSFTDTLVAIHTVDWRSAGLSLLGVPEPGTDFVRRELAKWRGLIDASGLEPDPVLVDVLCWLDSNVPSADRLVLVHGAYRTGNLLIDDDRVTAVLDWETEVIGDPMYDVAYVLSALNREGTELLSNVVAEDAFRRRYEAGTGFAIDDEACWYYQVLYAMRSAAFWMSATGLFVDGRNDDLRLARTAWSIPVVLDNAARAIGY
jgi:aminoglycoside phosphotransferase (APT) family kinase protein